MKGLCLAGSDQAGDRKQKSHVFGLDLVRMFISTVVDDPVGGCLRPRGNKSFIMFLECVLTVGIFLHKFPDDATVYC